MSLKLVFTLEHFTKAILVCFGPIEKASMVEHIFDPLFPV